MAILVTGGAGYIGSHTAAALAAGNEEVIIADNLTQGHREAVLGGTLLVGDLRDPDFMDALFKKHSIEAVIHFAANSLVGESMRNPAKYYHNNVYGTLCLLEKMTEYGVGRIVFSSSAATYGEPENNPVKEQDRTMPTNPYGETKLAMEQMMKWFDAAHQLKYVSLRYFNAAGAHASGQIGEDHSPETHLIPLVLEVPLGRRQHISVYGDDYDTADGTCVRDYIHISDLADAHVLALGSLREGNNSSIYNLGSGTGFSVREVIAVARQVTGHPIPAVTEPRRAGDPAVLVASSALIRSELGWSPRQGSIEDIVSSAWNWHRTHPQGYATK